MENKINVAKLLKDCPEGMELDSTMLDNIVFVEIDVNPSKYPIAIRNMKTNETIYLTKYGQFVDKEGYKCIIFPKGKTTWEGFQRPFKNGDILYVDCTDESDDEQHEYIFILNKIYNGEVHSYCHYYMHDGFRPRTAYLTDDKYPIRFATEEEKEKLFQAIKENGYKWNSENKTLEKLNEPKFKVGDRVKHKSAHTSGIVVKISDKGYHIDYPKGEGICYVNFTLEKDYELAPNKFNIASLVPFESRVLVRDRDNNEWRGQFFSHYCKNSDNPYICIGVEGLCEYTQCIPFEGNEHLLGTTEDCDEFYKTWKQL